MGQAKRRGSYEDRKAKAIEANGGEERAKRKGAFEKRQFQRRVLREMYRMQNDPRLQEFY